MREFQCGDLIGYNSPDEGYIYGIVVGMTETKLEAEYPDDSWESFWVEKEKADYIEPIYLDDETVRKFARYEISFEELEGDVYPPQRMRAKEPHNLTMSELQYALKKASEMPAEQFFEEWFEPIWVTMRQSFICGDYSSLDAGDCGYRYLTSENYWVGIIMNDIDCHLFGNIFESSEFIEKVNVWKELFDLPFEQRNYPDSSKYIYIKSFDDYNLLDNATNDEIKLFVKFVEELCAKEETDSLYYKKALYAKAYGCYGGNRAFQCDWIASRDALLKLCEIDDNPFLANTLGYIFYYGRCTDGEPEYEKAFKYFSIGAAGGIYESQYKLSDMFRHGYGVQKNEKIASEIIWRLYDENIKYIFKSKLDCKFADVALRAGNLLRNGVGCDANINSAYYYYLQADFAIRMRMLEDDLYGDAKVADGIRKAIEEVLPETDYKNPQKTVRYNYFERLTAYRCQKHRLIEMKVKKAKDGELSIKLGILPKGDEKYQPKFFVTEPRAQFCGLCDSISAKTVGYKKLRIGNKLFRDESAVVAFDEADKDSLYLYGKKVAEFVCDAYKVVFPGKKNGDYAHFVSVVFTAGGRAYDYICDIPDVGVGDKVVVKTSDDENVVEVVRVFDKTSDETALPLAKYKTVLRKA